MEAVSQWGIDLITVIQQNGAAWLVDLFQAISFLGNQEFYLLLIPFLFWCMDWALGARLTILYLLAVWINTGLKDLIQQARPYEFAPQVALVDPESVYGTGFGMPSGHAQWAMVIWGLLATRMRKGWFWLLAGALIFLVGLSRVYLGMHYPNQVLAGWGLGFVIVLLFLGFHEPVERAIGNLSMWGQLGLAIIVPAILLALHPVPDVVAATAVLAGLSIGLVIAKHYAPYTIEGSWPQRLLRYLVGIIVVLAIYFGLSAIFPEEGEAFYAPLRFLRYGLVGLWISLGGPWLFQRTRLMRVAVQPA